MATAMQAAQLHTVTILHEQLDMCKTVMGRPRRVIEAFLYKEGIDTLDDVTKKIKEDYRRYIASMVGITEKQRKAYSTLLDQVLLSYLRSTDKELAGNVDKLSCDRAVKNKLLLYLLENGIHDCREIDYDLRVAYKEYLIESACKKINEYMKAMDLLKLQTILDDMEKNPLKPRTLLYGTKVFLLYHPDPEIAESFYYVRNKEELLFDFTIPGSETLKRQIFWMLNHVLENKHNTHDRRERFLIPLKKLYLYCIDNGIEDMEQLTGDQIEGFRESLEGKAGTKTDTYMQIIYNTTEYLFLSAKETNWDANIWHMERFTFSEGRANPARMVKTLTFYQIKSDENRAVMKEYMKYEFGVAGRTSIQTIRGIFYDNKQFMRYCDAEGIDVTDIKSDQMEKYIQGVDSEDLKPETFNRRVISVSRLYRYMKSRKIIKKMPVSFDHYLKSVYTRHNNRTVPADMQKEILQKLKHLPMHLRLMFLHLWCTGIRESEVCVIKAGMYSVDGNDAWLGLYQNKMKKEKIIPIPMELYRLMQAYIEKNKIGPDGFVFTNSKDGAYDADTFSKQLKKEFKKAGIGYDFRSHDFRHTVATSLDRDHRVPIEVIREFLGHDNTDMTKQYIDFVPEKIDEANAEYFSHDGNSLAGYVKDSAHG